MSIFYWTPRIDGGIPVIVSKPAFFRTTVDKTTAGVGFLFLMDPNAIATSAGQELLLQFTMSASPDAVGAIREAQIRLVIDGMPVGDGTALSSMAVGADDNPVSAALQHQTLGLSPGAHTVAVEWTMISLPGEMQCRAASVSASEHADLTVWTLR